MLKNTIILFLGLILFTSCKSEYDRLVTKEKESGVMQDSLYLGMKMGMTRQQFFEACAALNKDSLVQQGKGVNVSYEIPLLVGEDSVKRKDVNFFAIFDKDKIVRGMQFTFSYRAWSLWNKELQSSNLLIDLKDRFEKEYGGNKFIEFELEGFKNKIWVKVDGNRRMIMYPKDGMEVRLKMEDLNNKVKLLDKK
jgi:hypothetical protein